MNTPVKQVSFLDLFLTLWIISSHGSRYRNRVSLLRSTDDDNKLSDREFLDPNRDRAHPCDVSPLAIQKVWNML
jgi:hypothetical protein